MMARRIDPKNLTLGDALYVIAPTVALVAVVVVIGRFAPQYVPFLVIAVGVGVVIYVSKLPANDRAAIADAERRLDRKIDSLPIVGPIVGPLWRIFSLIVSIVSAVLMILVIYLAIRNVL